MNNNPLLELRDVHLPSEPSWWPPAIGYYLVALLLVLLMVLCIYFYRKSSPRRLIKRQVLQELLKAERHYLRTREIAPLQAEVSSVVRRLAAYKAQSTTLLSDESSDLYRGVRKLSSDTKKTEELITLLEKDRFKKEVDVDGHRIILLAGELVKKCRI